MGCSGCDGRPGARGGAERSGCPAAGAASAPATRRAAGVRRARLRLLGLLLGGPPCAAAAGAGGAGAAGVSEAQLLDRLRGGEAVEELPLLRSCVARSWWGAARELVARAHRRAEGAGAGEEAGGESLATIRAEVTSLLAGVRQSADSFAAYAEQTYRGQTGGIHDEVPCALQWAQNSTAVFLGVKYAARWSAPGAIEVVDVTVNSSDCCFHLGGYGHHSSIRKHYLVNLTLFADVDAQMTSWSSGSVGRMTATLHKRRAGRWPRLVASTKKSRHQVTKWLDMAEKWDDELKRNAPTLEDTQEAAASTTTRTTTASREEAPASPSKKGPKKALTPSQKEWAKRWKRLRAWSRKLWRQSPAAVAGGAGCLLALVLALVVLRCRGRPAGGKVEAEGGEADRARLAAEAARARAEGQRAPASRQEAA